MNSLATEKQTLERRLDNRIKIGEQAVQERDSLRLRLDNAEKAVQQRQKLEESNKRMKRDLDECRQQLKEAVEERNLLRKQWRPSQDMIHHEAKYILGGKNIEQMCT